MIKQPWAFAQHFIGEKVTFLQLLFFCQFLRLSGGDNLSATFSLELADLIINVIEGVVFTNLETGQGLDEVIGFVEREGMPG